MKLAALAGLGLAAAGSRLRGAEPTTAAPLRGVVEKGPLYLQDHGNPVRFRNVWIRPL